VGNRTSTNSSLPGGSLGRPLRLQPRRLALARDLRRQRNTLTTGGKTFAYDSEPPDVDERRRGTMIYDGFRQPRLEDGWQRDERKYLVEDDVNPTGLPQVFEESVNGVVLRTYTYGPTAQSARIRS